MGDRRKVLRKKLDEKAFLHLLIEEYRWNKMRCRNKFDEI